MICTRTSDPSDNVHLTGECKYAAAEQILRFAKNNKIDMIVMGSQRLKGISRLKALGSVTRKVSESADYPAFYFTGLKVMKRVIPTTM